jgi:hypothetical protein
MRNKFRWYIKDSERKPDPQPMQTNARLAILVGSSIWLIALVYLLAFKPAFAAEQPSATYTCIAGLGLGIYAFWHVGRRG